MARVGRWHNTQENAFALMAVGKIGRVLGQDPFLGVIQVGDARADHVAFVDLLPAGLEIEKPRLSGDPVFDWMEARSARQTLRVCTESDGERVVA